MTIRILLQDFLNIHEIPKLPLHGTTVPTMTKNLKE